MQHKITKKKKIEKKKKYMNITEYDIQISEGNKQ